MGRKITVVLLFIGMVLGGSVPWLFAGVTGKIAGIILDKSTGVPLPGANIVVVGTNMGTVSDEEGNFVILNVPPGQYALRASFLGYAQMIVQEVDVRIDQTTRVDFKLQPEVIKGETITIVAERKVVKPDVSTSSTAVTSKEIVALPVSNVSGIVGMQAGIRGLDIRGSSANAALFMVDGVTLRDPRNNEPISTVPLNAVEAISIERGGFNAEYGQVQSGIINVVTREGSKERYQLSGEFRYVPPKPKYSGISPYDPKSYWLRPYLDDQVCWVGTEAGWDKYTARQYPKFDGWNAISYSRMTDDIPENDLSPKGAQKVFLWEHRRRPVTDQPDYDADMGFGGPIPLIGKSLGDLRFFSSYRRHREVLLVPLTRDDYVEDDFMTQLTSDITPSMKLRITGMKGARYTHADNWVYGWEVRSPERIAERAGESGIFSTGWFSLSDITYWSMAGKLTHVLSPKTFYDVSIEHLARSYWTRPPAPYDTARTHLLIGGYGIYPPYYVNEAPFGYNPDLGAKGINSMGFGGHSCRFRDDSRVSVTTLRTDFSSQVNPQHLVKTGLELVYNQLHMDYRTAGVNIQDTTRRDDYPIRVAWYIQDKMETKGFILNAGIRLDYSNSNAEWPDVDPFSPYFSTKGLKFMASENYRTQKTKGQLQVSPRLGISHPVTENSKLFFNYGHFKQIPAYETLFRLTRTQTGQISQIGDPNLTLAKTISYELGYDHSLFENRLLVQLAAFYKDISDQQLTVNYYGLKDISYTKTTSNGYADIRGFELTLKKPVGRWWNGFANYTYQATKSGRFGRGNVYQDPSQQARYDRDTRNLYISRPIPQPYARANISFFTPPDFGLSFKGIRPLGDWLLNVLFDWQAGGYMTWNPKNLEAISNNVPIVDWYNLTLRLSKKFTIRPFDVYMFADVGNALNTKFLALWGSINSFSDYQDQIDYMESLHLPKHRAYDNIPGHDKFGDYRKPGVRFQPIERRGQIFETDVGEKGVIYWDQSTQKYMEYNPETQQWSEVDHARMKKILDTKAYIDMPNQSSFWFLNPRRVSFGIRVTLNL